MSSASVHSAALNSTSLVLKHSTRFYLCVLIGKDQLSLLRSLILSDPKLVNVIDVVGICFPVMQLMLIALQDERTPLHWAASSGSLDIVQFLIDHGAEVDKADGMRWTPLHIAGQCLLNEFSWTF
jgi:hypothetical protein